MERLWKKKPIHIWDHDKKKSERVPESAFQKLALREPPFERYFNKLIVDKVQGRVGC